jgi:hypothetical protein
VADDLPARRRTPASGQPLDPGETIGPGQRSRGSDPSSLKHGVLAYLALPLALTIAIFVTTPLTENNGGLDSDGVFYAAMAGMEGIDARGTQVAPWCYRVLTPALVALLPFETLLAFRVLVFISSYLSLVLLYLLIRRTKVSHPAALLAMVWYAGIFWTLKFSFYSPAYIDFQTQFLLLSILLGIVSRKWWIVVLLIGIGTLQKESLLLLSPVAWVHYARFHGWRTARSLRYAALLVVLPTVAWLAARSAVEPINEYSSLGVLVSTLQTSLDPAIWPRFTIAIFSGLGMLPLVVLANARRSLELLRRNPLWATLLALGALMLLGGVDKSRLFLYSAPALIWLVARITDDALEQGRKAQWVSLAAALVLHLYLGHLFSPMGSFADYLNRMVPMHAPGPLTPTVVRLGAVVLGWTAILLWSRARESKSEPA